MAAVGIKGLGDAVHCVSRSLITTCVHVLHVAKLLCQVIVLSYAEPAEWISPAQVQEL